MSALDAAIADWEANSYGLDAVLAAGTAAGLEPSQVLNRIELHGTWALQLVEGCRRSPAPSPTSSSSRATPVHASTWRSP